MREREQIVHRVAEPAERGRPGIALVAALDAPPTARDIAPVPESVSRSIEHVLGVQVEQVVARRLQGAGPLGARRHADRLDRVDPERLDDRAERLFGYHPVRLLRPARGTVTPAQPDAAAVVTLGGEQPEQRGMKNGVACLRHITISLGAPARNGPASSSPSRAGCSC